MSKNTLHRAIVTVCTIAVGAALDFARLKPMNILAGIISTYIMLTTIRYWLEESE